MRKNKPKLFRPIGAARRHALEGAPLASFARRLAAFGIDMVFVCLLVAIALIPSVVSEGRKTGAYNMRINPFHGWALLSLPLYFGLATYLGRGRTIGKRLMRIKIVSLTGDHLSLWLCIQRSLGYATSTLTFGSGFLQYFTHPNCQTVHDLLCETIVVSELQMPTPPSAPGRITDPAVSLTFCRGFISDGVFPPGWKRRLHVSQDG